MDVFFLWIQRRYYRVMTVINVFSLHNSSFWKWFVYFQGIPKADRYYCCQERALNRPAFVVLFLRVILEPGTRPNKNLKHYYRRVLNPLSFISVARHCTGYTLTVVMATSVVSLVSQLIRRSAFHSWLSCSSPLHHSKWQTSRRRNSVRRLPVNTKFLSIPHFSAVPCRKIQLVLDRVFFSAIKWGTSLWKIWYFSDVESVWNCVLSLAFPVAMTPPCWRPLLFGRFLWYYDSTSRSFNVFRSLNLSGCVFSHCDSRLCPVLPGKYGGKTLVRQRLWILQDGAPWSFVVHRAFNPSLFLDLSFFELWLCRRMFLLRF